jgi:hypothetical protein
VVCRYCGRDLEPKPDAPQQQKPKFGLGRRGFFVFMVVLLIRSIGWMTGKYLENARMAKEAEAVRLAEMRANDPDAYLTHLRHTNDGLWLEALKKMQPDKYLAETERRARVAAEAAAAKAEKERLAKVAEEEQRAREAQAELDATVATILKSIRDGDWDIADQALGRLGDGDLAATYDEFEAVALSVVRLLPASDLSGNRKGYAFLSKLRPDNVTYRDKAERYAAKAIIPVPSDSKTTYEALEQRSLNGGIVEITVKRIGPSEVSFTRREVNCKAWTFRYTGDTDTELELASQSLNNPFGPLVRGSISDYISIAACWNR